MDLWIRSQSKHTLIQIKSVYVNDDDNNCEDVMGLCSTGHMRLGKYKSKERALEVLDEIQNKMNPKYFYKTNCLMKPEQLEKMETILQQKYNADFIVGSASDEIEPLSNDVLVYEMPEE